MDEPIRDTVTEKEALAAAVYILTGMIDHGWVDFLRLPETKERVSTASVVKTLQKMRDLNN